MTLAEARRLFDALCKDNGVKQSQIIRRRGLPKICEARIRIIQDLHAAGAKVWQIKEIIPRDETTIRHSIRKVL